MSTAPVNITRAKLVEWSGSRPKEGGQQAQVQFNPATLTLQNGDRSRQQKGTLGNEDLSRIAATLSVSLLFDTSVDEDAPRDVQEVSRSVWAFLTPTKGEGNDGLHSPLLAFSWGMFLFIGKMISCSETLQAFTADGTPFRAELQIALEGYRSTAKG